jgi:hypothetical protein
MILIKEDFEIHNASFHFILLVEVPSNFIKI